MRESALENSFRRGVKQVGGIPVKLVSPTAGVPDRMVLWPGGVIELVELKTEIGQLRPIQRVWHARAAEKGVTVTVLHGPDELRQWLGERSED